MVEKHVVKRRGHKEKFDERKLYGSVYAACAVVRMGERECESIANFVTKKVKVEIKGKKEIDSSNIANMVIKHLKKKHKEAAFMYENHRDIA